MALMKGNKPQVILIRHGETALNSEDTSLDRIRGWDNIALNKSGVKEAKKLADEFAYSPVDKIYSSDLSRALDTAKQIAKYHKVKVIPTQALRPWGLGVYQGQVTEKVWPELLKLTKNETQVPKDGESFKSFRLRVLKVFQRLMDEAIQNKLLTLVVAHYRNLKLIEAWEARGFSPDFTIDTNVFTKNDKPTGETYEVSLKDYMFSQAK